VSYRERSGPRTSLLGRFFFAASVIPADSENPLHRVAMNGHEAAKICERVWRLLPPDDEDALNVLLLVADRFVSIDETGHNRELFIKWLEHTRRD
jgi:hypothetical protein